MRNMIHMLVHLWQHGMFLRGHLDILQESRLSLMAGDLHDGDGWESGFVKVCSIGYAGRFESTKLNICLNSPYN